MSGARRIWAAGVLGLLLGAAVIQAVDSAHLQSSLRSQRLAEETAARLRYDLASVRRELTVVSELGTQDAVTRVIVTPVESFLPEDDVTAALDPYTRTLIGEPLNTTTPEVLWRLFNGRLLTIRGRLYRVHVLVMLLAPTSRLLVRLTRAAP